MISLLAAGFLLRVWQASKTFLNPDEALHFFTANKASWGLTAKASLTISHPPLLILLLHAWRSLGTSELMLRMPSILAGTLFCCLIYKWSAMLFRDSVVWIVFILALFLPSSVDLSTEIRQYALLLAFAMGSAYLLELALARKSAPAMLGSGACLWLAICSHYSSFLFAAALGSYAIMRMLKDHPPRRIFVAWVAGQTVALGLCCFFYKIHISRLGQSYGGANAAQGWMANAYLGNSYFVPGKINPLLFIFARTGGVFQYVFGQSAIGDLGFLIFVIGMVLVFRKPAYGSLSSSSPSRQLGMLLLGPFAFNCAAALVRAYPYGGTRHSAFLLPFALAGVGVALAHFLRNRASLGMILALVIALVCNLFPTHRLPYMSPQDQRRGNMQAALGFMHQEIAPGEIIFADYQTSLMLDHYLCDQRPVAPDHSVPGFISYECGGHRVIATDWNTVVFTARSFYDQWQLLVKKYSLSPGTRVWVAHMGWSTYLAMELEKFPEFHLAPHFFGDRIQIFDLTVGQSMPDPKLLPTP